MRIRCGDKRETRHADTVYCYSFYVLLRITVVRLFSSFHLSIFFLVPSLVCRMLGGYQRTKWNEDRKKSKPKRKNYYKNGNWFVISSTNSTKSKLSSFFFLFKSHTSSVSFKYELGANSETSNFFFSVWMKWNKFYFLLHTTSNKTKWMKDQSQCSWFLDAGVMMRIQNIYEKW